MLKAALCTIAKTWKRPKRPLTDEWIKEMWYIYTMEYYSAMKKNKIMPSAAIWSQLQIIILSEVRKKKTDTVWYNLHVESKIWHKWTYLQNRNRLTENKLVVAKGDRGGEGLQWEFGVSRRKLWHIELISNKDLLYSTGNYNQHTVMEKNMKKNVHICITELLCCTAETNTTLQINHTSIKKLKQKKVFNRSRGLTDTTLA